MLTHSITKYEPVKVEERRDSTRFTGIIRSEEHKKFIHARTLLICENNGIVEGDQVRYLGQMACVVDIYKEDRYAFVEWNDLECKCIELFLYDSQECVCVHPGSIRRGLKCI